MKASTIIVNRVNCFMAKIQSETEKHYKIHFSILPVPVFSIDEGSKFFKLVYNNGTQTMVHCFVSKLNGDIYKAATFKAPAKHVRGNIFDADYGWGTAVNLYGAKYIRNQRKIMTRSNRNAITLRQELSITRADEMADEIEFAAFHDEGSTGEKYPMWAYDTLDDILNQEIYDDYDDHFWDDCDYDFNDYSMEEF